MKATANTRDIKRALQNLTENEMYTISELNTFIKDFYCGRLFIDYEIVRDFIIERANKDHNDWLNCIVINQIHYFWIDYEMLTQLRERTERQHHVKKIMVNGIPRKI